ncbi:MAG: GntR family transcriptional regulator [Nitrospinota bacterium]|jgi:DNA-binding GntR family transcriptional regulator|nr:GntR family transcriptional regulator [Nitrospinota bacterium]MDP7502691.1 GntR family transcriptional regulator [Nitrospinota bacterium]MDP7663305.1 GntR family transcriptional regulator [Nitrospinota bacterium]
MAIRNLHIDRPKSLSRMVADEIMDAILKGALRPGDKLVEAELTQSLGVSRTPLREAFRELAAEGYITVIPHKGSYVSTISEEEVLDLYSITSVLEGLATRLATPRLKSGEEKENLLALFEDMKKKSELGEVDAYWASNRNFHQSIAKTSGNDRLSDLIENLRRQILKTRVITLRYPGRLEGSMTEHEEILRAILGGKEQEAEKLITDHLEKQRQFVLSLIRNMPDSQEISQ